MIQTQENGKKPHSESDFCSLSPNLDCLLLLLSPPPKKNLTSSITRYHDQLSSCTISAKTNDQP